MQTIAMHHESSAVVLGMPAFGPMLYAGDPGVDHPTPPAPDRGSGGKAKPKRKPAAKAKNKKKKKK